MNYLAAAGADASAAGFNKASPLHIAALCGYGSDMVEALRVGDADAMPSDCITFTPLHISAYFGHERVNVYVLLLSLIFLCRHLRLFRLLGRCYPLPTACVVVMTGT